jgi:hypothetical protein
MTGDFCAVNHNPHPPPLVWRAGLYWCLAVPTGGLAMSLVLEKYQQQIASAVAAYRAEIDDVEVHLRLRAMANDSSDAEIRLLQRLKAEKAEVLYRYKNLSEAFKAVLGDTSMAAE